MIRVIEGLYLGNREDARDLGQLETHGITHVVNCTAELPNYHAGTLTYLTLHLRDPDPAFRDHVERVCVFIDEARKEGEGVLVYCFAAVSRSPSIVLAYLCHLGDSLEAAARRLGRVTWTAPDVLFLKQLADCRGEALSEKGLAHVADLLRGGEKWGA